jgi:hypothetical protein
VDVSGVEDEDSLPSSQVLELPVACSPEEIPVDEQSYPDPDYLPLPGLLLGSSTPLVSATGTSVDNEESPQVSRAR